MGLNTAETIVEGDFITQAQKDATPANDANKVPKNEADGRLSPWYTRNGAVLNCGETINGGTLPVPVYQNKTDNELYACDANDLNRIKFIGFVTSNGTDGAAATFQGQGVVSGFTGLAEGEKYYVQDTVGTIGTTPGTYEVLVGIAISETQLLIMRGKHRRNGVLTLTDGGADESTQTSTVTLGFRPSVIRAMGVISPLNSAGSLSQGSWVNGVYASVLMGEDAGGSTTAGANTGQLLDQRNPSGVQHWVITITSVTDTGFTFSALQKDASPTILYIAWEAEGEL